MSIYAIADLHLSLEANKPMDIFPGWENYTEKLHENLNTVLKAEDTLIIPGDISWGISLQESLKDFIFIDNLPGRKIISKGNHDYFWSTMRKMENFFLENDITTIDIMHNNSYVVEGYAICGTRGWVSEGKEENDQKIIQREAGRLELSIISAKKHGLPILCFLHYPPIFAGNKSKEIWDVLKKYEIDRCFYGHLHGHSMKLADEGIVEGISLKLISADYLGFEPFKII